MEIIIAFAELCFAELKLKSTARFPVELLIVLEIIDKTCTLIGQIILNYSKVMLFIEPVSGTSPYYYESNKFVKAFNYFRLVSSIDLL